MSVSLTKLFFDKGISGDKCCHYPIGKPEATSINLLCNLIGLMGSSRSRRDGGNILSAALLLK